MADPAGTYSDGTVVFGSQTVSIDSVTYIADDINYDKPTIVITRKNEVCVPTGEVLIDDVATGSLTLQLATSATKPPKRGAAFTIKDAGGDSVAVKVSKVGTKFSSMGETKVNIDIRQRLAGGTGQPTL